MVTLHGLQESCQKKSAALNIAFRLATARSCPRSSSAWNVEHGAARGHRDARLSQKRAENSNILIRPAGLIFRHRNNLITYRGMGSKLISPMLWSAVRQQRLARAASRQK